MSNRERAMHILHYEPTWVRSLMSWRRIIMTAATRNGSWIGSLVGISIGTPPPVGKTDCFPPSRMWSWKPYRMAPSGYRIETG